MCYIRGAKDTANFRGPTDMGLTRPELGTEIWAEHTDMRIVGMWVGSEGI